MGGSSLKVQLGTVQVHLDLAVKFDEWLKKRMSWASAGF